MVSVIITIPLLITAAMDGLHSFYNVQTAVDKGSHLLADYQVTNHNTDQGLLNDVAQGVKKSLGIETVEVVEDKGYDSREDILNCIMNGIVPNVALKYDKHERLYTIEYEDAEVTEDIRNSTKPEDIQIGRILWLRRLFYASRRILAI